MNALLGAVFGLWGLSVGLRQLSDNSFMTHLATGRLILDGTFPRGDVYSFTALDAPWVVQSWLASVLFAAAEQWAGGFGIQVLIGGLSAVLGVLFYVLSRPAEQLISRFLVAGGCMLVGSYAWSARPLMFGLLGLALTLLSLEGRLHPAWLLGVLWIWANSHGSYPLALVAVAAFALGRRFDGEAPREELRVLAYVAVGTALAPLGPLGLRVLTFPVDLLQRSDLLGFIREWQSPGFDGLWTRSFLLLLVFGVLGLVRRPSFRSAVPFVVFLALALVSARNIAPASVVFVVCLSPCWAGIGSIRGDRRSPAAAAGVAAMAVLGFLLVVGTSATPAWNFDTYPVRAMDYVADAGFWKDPDVHVATQDLVGNLRSAIDGPDARVFFDDRVDMYPRDVVEDYIVLARGGARWAQVLDRYEIDVIIWDRAEPLSSLLVESPTWQVLFQDDTSVVVCRRGSAACAV